MRATIASIFLLFSFLVLPVPVSADPSISSRLPGEIQSLLREDLAFLHSLSGDGSSPTFSEIFSATYDGETLADFLSARIRSFDSDDCNGEPGTVACVISALSPNILFLTPDYARFAMPQVFRVSVLLHESRHSEEAYRYHVRCPDPFRDDKGNDIVSSFSGLKLAGQLACDANASGAYGVQVEFLGNTQLHCQNCSEKVKTDAELYAQDALLRVLSAGEKEKIRQDLGFQ
jgi:hypothetical protein